MLDEKPDPEDKMVIPDDGFVARLDQICAVRRDGCRIIVLFASGQEAEFEFSAYMEQSGQERATTYLYQLRDRVDEVQG